jgi:cysteine desulfurase/selenocysteine lyase
VQGNRWYESWNRADLDETSQNPANPLQLNISPIRNWRALEVFLYLWWQKVQINPLYNKGLERIGCFLCPAMLESEYEELRIILPEYARRWDAFLEKWADKKGLPVLIAHGVSGAGMRYPQRCVNCANQKEFPQ